MHGFYRISTCVPRLKVADVRYNIDEMKRLAAMPQNNEAAVILFPELAVTGYTCADLFHNSALLEAAERGVAERTYPRRGSENQSAELPRIL